MEQVTAEQISQRLEALDGDLPDNARDALRKAKARGQLPSLGTLITCAAAKRTTVAHLLGEDAPTPPTDHPAETQDGEAAA